MEVKWRMPFIIDDDWKQKRLDLIREYIHVIKNRASEREEEMNDDIWFTLSPTIFTDAGLRSVYVNELNEFLIPIFDLTDEWEADYLAQEQQRPWHLVDDRRRTLYLVHNVLRHNENIPEGILSRACRCSNRTYRFAAAANPNTPEEDRVYAWLRENAEVPA